MHTEKKKNHRKVIEKDRLIKAEIKCKIDLKKFIARETLVSIGKNRIISINSPLNLKLLKIYFGAMLKIKTGLRGKHAQPLLLVKETEPNVTT